MAESVFLRAIEPEDLDLLYKIENDMELWNVGVTNVPYSKYFLHDYIANASNDIYRDCQVRMMIENRDGEVVGIIDLMNFTPRHCRAEVGIVIENRYRNKGYALAALQKIADYSRSILHLHQLYVLVNSSDTAARGLFEKAGYSCAFELKDWLFDGKKYHNAVVMQFFL